MLLAHLLYGGTLGALSANLFAGWAAWGLSVPVLFAPSAAPRNVFVPAVAFVDLGIAAIVTRCLGRRASLPSLVVAFIRMGRSPVLGAYARVSFGHGSLLPSGCRSVFVTLVRHRRRPCRRHSARDLARAVNRVPRDGRPPNRQPASIAASTFAVLGM